MKFFNRLILVLAIGFTYPLFASTAGDNAKGRQIREQVKLNLTNVPIDDFIKMVSKIIHKNILITQKIPGTINFISTTPIYKDEIMSILIAVLNQKGYTVVKDGNYLRITRMSKAVKEALPIGVKDKYLMSTAFIKVDRFPVDSIAAKIRIFLSPAGKLITLKESNVIIVSDYPKNIEVIQRIIKTIQNQKNTEVITKFVPLKNAKASKVTSQLKNIVQTILDTKIMKNKVSIMEEDATNSVIVIASSENLKKILPIIKKLDAADNASTQKLAVFRLENSEAADIVKSLREILAKKKYAKESDKPMISSYEALNAVIVSARGEDIKNIREMIKVLDIQKPQVYVKAKIVEISNSQTKKLGMKYGLSGGSSTDNGFFSFAANLGGSTIALDQSIASLIKEKEVTSGIALGATIDFLAGNGAAKILSEPSILCINNKESSIYVGKTQSVLQSSVQGNQTTDLARNTYKREDIGLTLKVKPRLSSGNQVTLNVGAVLEDIVDSSIPGLPTTTKREVNTMAIVKNGESVIIGGLIKQKDSKSTSKIPGLGDIPYVGNLFKSTSHSTDQINLVIILTPYIVKHSEDLKRLKTLMRKLSIIEDRYESLLSKELEKRASASDKKSTKKNGKSHEKKSADPLEIITPSKSRF